MCFEQWFARKIVKLSYLYSFRKIQTIPLFESEITLPSLEYNCYMPCGGDDSKKPEEEQRRKSLRLGLVRPIGCN